MGMENLILAGLLATQNPTALTEMNIQGEYLIRAKDVYMVALINIKNEKASISFRTQSGQNTQCLGSYKFDKKQMSLVTAFDNCLGGKVSHNVNLKGQVLETLKAGTELPIFVQIGSEVSGTLQFSLVKRK